MVLQGGWGVGQWVVCLGRDLLVMALVSPLRSPIPWEYLIRLRSGVRRREETWKEENENEEEEGEEMRISLLIPLILRCFILPVLRL